ncbi:hypothetical protein CN027_23220 [Salmonella enterica subsp. enterica serovar Java]|nr:hypothetical protein [Salmonella enterica subsp. enterica serovar Java]
MVIVDFMADLKVYAQRNEGWLKPVAWGVGLFFFYLAVRGIGSGNSIFGLWIPQSWVIFSFLGASFKAMNVDTHSARIMRFAGLSIAIGLLVLFVNSGV